MYKWKNQLFFKLLWQLLLTNIYFIFKIWCYILNSNFEKLWRFFMFEWLLKYMFEVHIRSISIKKNRYSVKDLLSPQMTLNCTFKEWPSDCSFGSKLKSRTPSWDFQTFCLKHFTKMQKNKIQVTGVSLCPLTFQFWKILTHFSDYWYNLERNFGVTQFWVLGIGLQLCVNSQLLGTFAPCR